MKWKRKPVLLYLLFAVILLVTAGCAAEETPYEINDSQQYTVSVKFDANGGTFTVNAPVIVDSFNVSQMPVDGEGMAQIPLLAPDDALRGKDAFKPVNSGHFLVGWYAECTKTTDENGNEVCTYGKPWDFETDRLPVDPNEAHTSAEPILTLYAAWAPLYELEVYDRDSGEKCGSYTFDPTESIELKLPAWDPESGSVDMYKFPEKKGYTFIKAYLDAEGTQALEAETVTHPGTVNRENATVENRVFKVYTDWKEGTWYRISTAEQFADNYSPMGNYELMADLDFTDEIWPTAMMYGEFSGTILGNGHTISNVSITQTDNAKQNAGLFGQLAGATLQDVSFDNITFTLKKGARMAGTSYGLLTGTVKGEAQLENVNITNSRILIDSGCYFGTDDYSIGLVSGFGDLGLDHTGITCEATGDAPEKVVITVTDNAVDATFVSE